MQKDGQPSSTLAERLALKLERERQQVEALTESELRKLGENLKNVSKDVLLSMQNDIQEQTGIAAKNLGWILKPIYWTCGLYAAMVIAFLMLLFTVTEWKRCDLKELRELIRIEQGKLESLKEQTGGVSVVRASNGMFLLLPEGMHLKEAYDCNGRACLKLPEEN